MYIPTSGTPAKKESWTQYQDHLLVWKFLKWRIRYQEDQAVVKTFKSTERPKPRPVWYVQKFDITSTLIETVLQNSRDRVGTEIMYMEAISVRASHTTLWFAAVMINSWSRFQEVSSVFSTILIVKDNWSEHLLLWSGKQKDQPAKRGQARAQINRRDMRWPV
jgi:hypothetical protein